MLATTVVERQNFIGNTIYPIMGITILIVAILIGFFQSRSSVTSSNSIGQLKKSSTGETNVRIEVRRKDEIGELSDSFERMLTSLKIMMDVDES